jgi:4-coumarate--CoA ligase
MTDWWRNDNALARFVEDLLCAELARGRAQGFSSAQRGWPGSLELGPGGLGAPPAELAAASAALAEALRFEPALLPAAAMLGEWVAICAAHLERNASEITFRTSGSTDAPKATTHALGNLLAETAVHAGRLAGAKRVIAAVPSHHIYGFLFAQLLPQQMQVPVVDVRRALPLQPGDLVIGHPLFWKSFVRVGPFAPGVTGVTSTAPCPPEIARDVRDAGVGRLVQIYGSTETAGIAWRDDADGPWRLLEMLERASDVDSVIRCGDAAILPLPDHVEWLGPREFRLIGRRDGVVQVGGVNVSPVLVREVLLTHPDIADAAVRLMRAEEGDRLKAFIVPRDPSADPVALRRRIGAWINTALKPPERPRAIAIGAALPRSAMGKLADWDIAPTHWLNAAD